MISSLYNRENGVKPGHCVATANEPNTIFPSVSALGADEFGCVPWMGCGEGGGSGGRLAKSDVRGKWAAFIGQRGHKERIGIYKWNLISISIVSNLQCLMAKAPHPPTPHQPHCMVGGPIHCIMMWGQTSDFCYLYKWFDSQETQNLIRIVFQFPDTDNPLT